MKKKAIAILAMAALAMSVVAAPQAGAEHKKGAKSVAKDEEGDWGQNSALGADGAAMGDALGQDLVEGLIEMADEADEPTELHHQGDVATSSRRLARGHPLRLGSNSRRRVRGVRRQVSELQPRRVRSHVWTVPAAARSGSAAVLRTRQLHGHSKCHDV